MAIRQSSTSDYHPAVQNMFLPVYSALAKQIFEKTGLTEGHCLDIGDDGGHLGLLLARTTAMHVTLYSQNGKVMQSISKRAEEWALNGRVSTLYGDACLLPFKNEWVDLCVSRNALWFWKDTAKAIKEICRVLKYDGYAFIGPLTSTPAKHAGIPWKLPDEPRSHDQKNLHCINIDHLTQALRQLNLRRHEMIDGQQGMWLILKKG